MNILGERLLKFYTNLKLEIPKKLKVDVLNPYTQKEVVQINKIFYKKYYNDKNSRILLLGINPGRFGAGITGISFTDPVILEESLKINNSFPKKNELSATFIHQMIAAYGGVERFYSKFHLSAVCPLGFIKDNVNINYYDDPELMEVTKPFIIQTLEQQIDILKSPTRCVCIGRGKNLDFLKKLNKEKSFFKEIDVLPHPRWILQYKRKKTGEFTQEYVRLLKNV